MKSRRDGPSVQVPTHLSTSAGRLQALRGLWARTVHRLVQRGVRSASGTAAATLAEIRREADCATEALRPYGPTMAAERRLLGLFTTAAHWVPRRDPVAGQKLASLVPEIESVLAAPVPGPERVPAIQACRAAVKAAAKAVAEAGHTSGPQGDAWAQAHRALSAAQENLAGWLPASEAQGAAARRGAVASALSAGEQGRALDLARGWLLDRSLDEATRRAILKDLFAGTPSAMPVGLSKDGLRAAYAVLGLMTEYGTTDTGGCRTFYTPSSWAARGEKYGRESALIVVHDGGDVASFFNADLDWVVARIEAMRRTLDALGFYAERCTSWYSAIYVR